VEGANSRDLLIFLVFCVIAATFLLQGLTLPWLLKILGMQKYGQQERYGEHLAELSARLKMIVAALHWLSKYKEQVKNNQKLSIAITLNILRYRMLKKNLKERIASHDGVTFLHDEREEIKDEACLLTQLVEVEKTKLLELWHQEKINLAVRDKLLEELDHRARNIPG